MGSKITKEISITEIQKKFEQLKLIKGSRFVKFVDLAKEIGVKSTKLMDVVQENPKLFKYEYKAFGKNKKVELSVVNVYLEIADNPETGEHKERELAKYQKSIKLSHYNNYGHIHGVYIEPIKDSFVNTPEKIKLLKEKYLLTKPAIYYLGGFGDCSTIKPENGLELSLSDIQEMTKDGWTIIGEYLEYLK